MIEDGYSLTTHDVAKSLGVRNRTITERLCRHGHLFGVQPIKLHNGRLAFPDDTIEQIRSQSRKR